MNDARQLRQQFLDYFAGHGHTVAPPCSLVPPKDPSLLFTNSGMVQFKDIFLGCEQEPWPRACSSQRSLRVGGKHNDLEVVGHTRRHLTLFEMLGNFSFGDYFKAEAIDYAWTFVRRELALAPERLWVTVHRHDEEAADLWRRIAGLADERILRIDSSDNFWQMGSTGPCGYCSEIFYDLGDHLPGTLPGTPDQDGDRYTELWNLVFMEFSLHSDGRRTPLARKSVDTGMGLERLESIVQGVDGIFAASTFMSLKATLAERLGLGAKARAKEEVETALNVMADHTRAATLMIHDGVHPGNDGRGYVLRRLIRRAIRYGFVLGREEPFLHGAVAAVAEHFADTCEDITARQGAISQLVHSEEERFYRTLDKGMRVLGKRLDAGEEEGRRIDGEFCFCLYDRYGFPLDLTRQMAEERGFSVDDAGFGRLMEEQRSNARAARAFTAEEMSFVPNDLVSEFVGYERAEAETRIAAIFCDGESVEELTAGREAMIALESTPFYAESGGQVGDVGAICAEKSQFVVEDTQRLCSAWLHIGHLDGEPVRVGDAVRAEIDTARRERVMRNHSATHLMHQALIDVLGEHVRQRGSLVDERRTRFDFSHEGPLSEAELRAIEDEVNQQILLNDKTEAQLMGRQEATDKGAKALFGEKYGEEVRVLSIGNSCELCGGTHVQRSGDIGLFRVLQQSGVGAGVRRIEATTGTNVIDSARKLQALADEVSGQLSLPQAEDAPAQLRQLLGDLRSLQNERDRLKQRLFAQELDRIVEQAQAADAPRIIVATTSCQDMNTLRAGMDQLRQRCADAVLVLASPDESKRKVKLLVGIGSAVGAKVSAKDLVQRLSPLVGGKGGGGREDFAQAGGMRADLLPQLAAKARPIIASLLDGAP